MLGGILSSKLLTVLVSLKKNSDAITAHAPGSVARSYGAPMVGDMAEALKKFPRYNVG
jgi:hypothetical protein